MGTFNSIVAKTLSMTIALNAKLLFSLFGPELYPSTGQIMSAILVLSWGQVNMASLVLMTAVYKMKNTCTKLLF